MPKIGNTYQMYRPFGLVRVTRLVGNWIHIEPADERGSFNDDPIELLFDMHEDPGETRNLATDVQYKDVLEEHQHMLSKWNRNLDVAPNVPAENRWH